MQYAQNSFLNATIRLPPSVLILNSAFFIDTLTQRELGSKLESSWSSVLVMI